VIAIDDHPYARIDYRGDPDMPLPPYSSYGDIDIKKFFIYFNFLFFSKRTKDANNFLCYQVLTITLLHRCGFAMTGWVPMTLLEELGR
jgi:hypothetical protein